MTAPVRGNNAKYHTLDEDLTVFFSGRSDLVLRIANARGKQFETVSVWQDAGCSHYLKVEVCNKFTLTSSYLSENK